MEYPELIEFLKSAVREAVGIPDRDHYASPTSLPVGELVTYSHQLHNAARAGLHHDVRFGNKDTGLLSWVSRKGLPEPGQRRLAIEQPTHSHSYSSFHGDIPPGQYGSGHVDLADLGKALVTRTTPDSLHVSLASKGDPVRLLLHRLKNNQRHWMLHNVTPTDGPAGEFPKVHYKSIPVSDGEKAISSMPPGSVVQPKIDGSALFAILKRQGVDIHSYRKSTSGKPILHAERILGKQVPLPDLPRNLEGSVLRGEGYGVRSHPDGKDTAIPVQELGGLLNSSLEKSITRQKEHGIDLRTLLFDINKRGKKKIGPDVPYSERRKMIDELLQHLPQPKFHAPEEAKTPEEGVKMLHDVLGGKNKLTHEGVVLHKPHGVPVKIKGREESNIHIVGFEPGLGKYSSGRGIGAIHYSLESGGQPVGKVGTGLSDELRRDMAEHPEMYLGRTARIIHQGQFSSGAYRAPALVAVND